MIEVFHSPARPRLYGAAVLAFALLAGCQGLPPAGSPAAPSRSVDLPEPDGGTRTLVLQDIHGRALLSDGDHQRSLPVAAAHVISLGPVPADVARVLRTAGDSVLALSGPRDPHGFQPEAMEVVDDVPAAPPAPPGLPLYAPVLPRLQAEAFGAEGRAELVGDLRHGLVLQCAAGQAPAGVLLHGPLEGTLDRRHAALRLRLRGHGEFGLLVADTARQADQDPLPMGTLPAREGWQQVEVAVPDAQWRPSDWQSLTVACPENAAKLEMDSLELVFADRPAFAGERALWVWNPAAWRDDPQGLIDHIRASQAHEVFVTVPLADEKCTGEDCAVASPEMLAGFVQSARVAGVRVWAVAGDPLAVLPEERQAWRGRALAYARYNQAQPADARLAGIQYDIEAYLVPGYGQAPDAWNQRYLALLRDLREAGGGMPVDAVVPWWFGQGGNSPPELLDAMSSAVDRLTVMDYRTDASQVVQSALPFLDWGQRSQRSVHIAVESGPLPDLEWRRYARAGRGELWVVDLGGQPVYALLDAPVDGEGPAQVFASRGGHLVKASQTTFFDRPEALWRVVARLEDAFGAAQAFGGVAIHGLDHAWY